MRRKTERALVVFLAAGVIVLLAALYAQRAGADGGAPNVEVEEPSRFAPWYAGVGGAISERADINNGDSLGGVTFWAGRPVHDYFSVEARFAKLWGSHVVESCPDDVCMIRRNDVNAWLLTARGKAHAGPEAPGWLQWGYLVVGLGVLQEGGADASFGVELGAGVLVPVHAKVGLAVDVVYVINVAAPTLNSVLMTIGLQYQF